MYSIFVIHGNCKHRPASDMGEEEPMVQCGMAEHCTKGQWFHWVCKGITEDDVGLNGIPICDNHTLMYHAF